MRSPEAVRPEGIPARNSAASSEARAARRDVVVRIVFMVESISGVARPMVGRATPVQVIDSGRQPVAEIRETDAVVAVLTDGKVLARDTLSGYHLAVADADPGVAI